MCWAGGSNPSLAVLLLTQHRLLLACFAAGSVLTSHVLPFHPGARSAQPGASADGCFTRDFLERTFLPLEEAALPGLSDFLGSFTLQSCCPCCHLVQHSEFHQSLLLWSPSSGLCCWPQSLPLGAQDPTISWLWQPRLALISTFLTGSSLWARTGPCEHPPIPLPGSSSEPSFQDAHAARTLGFAWP